MLLISCKLKLRPWRRLLAEAAPRRKQADTADISLCVTHKQPTILSTYTCPQRYQESLPSTHRSYHTTSSAMSDTALDLLCTFQPVLSQQACTLYKKMKSLNATFQKQKFNYFYRKRKTKPSGFRYLTTLHSLTTSK